MRTREKALYTILCQRENEFLLGIPFTFNEIDEIRPRSAGLWMHSRANARIHRAIHLARFREFWNDLGHRFS